MGAALGAMAAGGLASTMLGAAGGRRVAHATQAAYNDYNAARSQYSGDMNRLTTGMEQTAGNLGTQYKNTLTDTVAGGPNMASTLHAGIASRIQAMAAAGQGAWQGPSVPMGAQQHLSGPQGAFAAGLQADRQQRSQHDMQPAAFQSALAGAGQQEQLYRMAQQQKLGNVQQQLGQQQQVNSLQQSFAAEPYALAQARFNAAMGQAQNAGNEQAMYGALAGLGGSLGSTYALAANRPGA